ncbi:hypothetical protein QWZ03_02500 [Chitinimonas viridis]|uniref:Transporter substrate-binding domain-containing protein n=2 Tax=Chitinimonas viridis TaxID=664880 RepID=A0ABT8B0V6_9NEIS|nr:hypothetical protein [Chitinimonas viridis]
MESMVLIPLLMATLATPAETVIFYYETRPPLTYVEGQGLGGLVGGPAYAAMQAAAVPASLVEAPFKRHMALIEQNRERACAIGRFKTPERERLGRYSLPIYRDGSFVAMVRAGDHRMGNGSKLLPLLGRRDIRVVLKEGYSYGPTLDAALAQMQAQRINTPDTGSGIVRMVAMNMADLTFAAEEEARTLLAEHDEQRGVVAVRRFGDMPPGELRYFFCSKQVPDSVMDRLNAALPPLK